jgi:hypothetical protein
MSRSVASGTCALLALLLALGGGVAAESNAEPSVQSLTIATRPYPTNPRFMVTVYGAVDNGRAGEVVDIEAKDCGGQFFRGVAGATTTDGGRYETEHFYRVTTTLRAVWREQTSETVTVYQRARPEISRAERAGRFRVSAIGPQSFWRKRVLVQRRTSGGWRTIRSVVLSRAGSFGEYYSIVKLSVPKRTLLRAFVPRSQALPCYVAGASDPIRA